MRQSTWLRTGRSGFDPGCRKCGDFSLLIRVQTTPGVHSAFYNMSTEGLSPGWRRPSVGLATLPLPIVLPAKEDLWQSLSYVASWNRGPGSLDSYGWLRGERRACHNKVITRPAGLKVPVWLLRVVSIATDSKQWPWLGFCQNHTSLVALWLDTFILCLTSSIFRSSLAHLFRDHLIFKWNYYSAVTVNMWTLASTSPVGLHGL